MGLWAKSRVIFHSLGGNATQSMRQLVHQSGFATSRVHRLKQAMERRDRSPASWLWDTAEGRRWFIRLVGATRDPFSLTRGVGAETLRAFFVRLRLAMPVGGSPRAVRG